MVVKENPDRKKSVSTLLSYRNQSISVNWFLYDRDLGHERLKLLSCCLSFSFIRDVFSVLSNAYHLTIEDLMYRSNPPEVFLGKTVLKINSKFIGEHPCQMLLCNFIEVTHILGSVSCTFAANFQNNFSGVLLNVINFLKIKCNFLFSSQEICPIFCQRNEHHHKKNSTEKISPQLYLYLKQIKVSINILTVFLMYIL